MSFIIRLATQPLVVAGFAAYALGAVAWMGVLARVPLSLAYPSLAIGYVLTAVLSWLVLGEVIPPQRWIAILVICGGVALLSAS